MSRPIRGDKGRFAGSVGDGKDRIPTPGVTPIASPAERPAETGVSMAQLHHDHIRQLAITTDTEIANLTREVAREELRMSVAISSIHHSLGHRRERVPGNGYAREYLTPTADTLAEAQGVLDDPEAAEWKKIPLRKALEEYETAKTARDEQFSRVRELDTVYRRHRWTRAFLVPGGHVHSSMGCSTCNRQGNDTEFVWLPQYSGTEENLIVEDAGERACTVCYPSAPVDVLQRPTRIYSDDERRQLEEAEARRAQREANRAARAAKAPTASGEPLVLEVGEQVDGRGNRRMRRVELKAERTALTYAADIVAAQSSGERWMAPYEVNTSHYSSVIDTIIDAIAEKRQCPRSEVADEITRKADMKIRKYRAGN